MDQLVKGQRSGQVLITEHNDILHGWMMPELFFVFQKDLADRDHGNRLAVCQNMQQFFFVHERDEGNNDASRSQNALIADDDFGTIRQHHHDLFSFFQAQSIERRRQTVGFPDDLLVGIQAIIKNQKRVFTECVDRFISKRDKIHYFFSVFSDEGTLADIRLIPTAYWGRVAASLISPAPIRCLLMTFH